MQFNRSIIALVLFTVLIGSGIIGNVSATSTYPIDPTVTVNATDGNNSIVDTLQDTFTRVVNLIVDIILAPFNAIATVFSNWGSSLSGWAGPIIAVFVIIIILVMVRIFSEFDEILDLNS